MTPTTWIDQLLEGTPNVYSVGMGQGLLDYVQQNIQLNPEQADACFTPLHQPLQVLAGAGTGKTMLITALPHAPARAAAHPNAPSRKPHLGDDLHQKSRWRNERTHSSPPQTSGLYRGVA
jgi:hypothetical protein